MKREKEIGEEEEGGGGGSARYAPIGADEVEQRPELVRVVLQGRACHEHSVLVAKGGEALAHDGAHALQEARIGVAQAVRLVDHHDAPRDLSQLLVVADQVVVRGDEEVELEQAP